MRYILSVFLLAAGVVVVPNDLLLVVVLNALFVKPAVARWGKGDQCAIVDRRLPRVPQLLYKETTNRGAA